MESGEIIWVTEASIYAGIAADDNAVFVSEADGTVMALVSVYRARNLEEREFIV